MRSLHILSRGAERWESKRMELRWLLAAAGKSEFGVCGVVGGMMVIELLAYTMRQDCGGIAAGEMREWKIG